MTRKKKNAGLLSLRFVFSYSSTFSGAHSVAAEASVSVNDDLNLLYTGLPSYPEYSTASTITIFGADAFAVSLDQGNSPLVGASRYGKGRVIAAGTGDYFNLTASTDTTEGKVTKNMLLWLTEDKSPNPATGATNHYSNALTGTDRLQLITKNDVSRGGALPIDQTVVSSWTNQLLDPLIYPIAYVDPRNVSNAEAIALEAYVKNGGSVIVTEKGWIMADYPSDAIRSQSKDPQNVKITDYPVQWLLNQAGLAINYDWLCTNGTNPKPSLDQVTRVNLSYLTDALKQVEENTKTFMDYAIAGENAPQDVWERINSSVIQGWKSIVSKNVYLSGVKSDIDVVMSTLALPLDRLQKPYTSVLVQYRSAVSSLDEAGVKYAGADVFPGKVDDTTPRVTKTIAVNMAYADTSYLRMASSPGHWVSTGSYAPPGGEITVEVPADEPDLIVQIGAHSDDLTSEWAKITKWDRLPSVVLKKKLNPGLNRINSPYGGLVYIIPAKSKAGRTVSVTIGGVVQAPYYVLGQTSEQAWKDTIRNYPAPWAELQSNHIMLTVPSDDIRMLDNPQQLMAKWDEIYGLYENMAGLAPNKPLPNKGMDNWPFRYFGDKQITNGWMQTGCPIMLYQGETETSKMLVNLDDIQHNGWGFWTELGHDFQMSAWTWSDNWEVTNNLHSLHVEEYYGNASRLKDSFPQAAQFVANTDPNKNFDSIDDPFVKLVMFAQLKYAYGWDFYAKLHTAYREMDQSSLPTDDQQKRNKFVLTASRIAGENLLEFFDGWGLKYSSNARDVVTALGLPKPANPIWYLTADIDKPQTIPQFQMSATATSEELVSENNAASMVLDGNPSTIGHTK
ncbi:M60 family metallopeptidase [Paenibacillus aestuarii]|uniref:M60 family metallopeptidase n=1 Tax=Paenibacillus aestuarii TaxID=516965 RepID=A0ABW0KB24_9BACL|nr:M60 family metallopeptidase [Paenibacillus aestuarii]